MSSIFYSSKVTKYRFANCHFYTKIREGGDGIRGNVFFQVIPERKRRFKKEECPGKRRILHREYIRKKHNAFLTYRGDDPLFKDNIEW